MEISVIKIRRSWDRLIFTTGISILIRQHLYIGTAPGRYHLNHYRSTVICAIASNLLRHFKQNKMKTVFKTSSANCRLFCSYPNMWAHMMLSRPKQHFVLTDAVQFIKPNCGNFIIPFHNEVLGTRCLVASNLAPCSTVSYEHHTSMTLLNNHRCPNSNIVCTFAANESSVPCRYRKIVSIPFKFPSPV